MLKVSEIISLPVISLYEGEFLGIIYNILFDLKRKKCKYLCVLNEESGIQHLLCVNDIYLIGKECLFIKNRSALELECNFDSELGNYYSPINLKTYNLSGDLIGTSLDIVISNKLEMHTILLDNGQEIESSNIFNLGKSIILVDNQNIKISRFRPKQKNVQRKKIQNNKVTILLNDEKQTPRQAKENSINKILTDFRFLIGRTISKDVVALNGELIARNGTVITKDIVNKASLYGKLVEITRYSKKTNQ